MKRYKRCGWFVVVLMSGLGLPAHAAPSLETINGIVAGFGPCGTIGVAPELSSFFTFAPGDQPFGSTRAACGYSGGYRTQTASTGLLTQHDNLGPVVLGPPINSPGSYSGTADSRASYGSLGAAAHSAIVGGLPEGEHALFNSVGAATFADSLTATSPLAPNGSVGSVSYLFHLDGSLSALGAPAAFFAGETYMALDIQHRGIGKIGVANATVRRGGLGTVKNGPPPAGWVTSTGSLSGGSDFVSVALPMVWGQAWDVKVGLLAWSYGTADADFLNTATLTGFEFFDANGVAVNSFSVSAASGTDYLNAVPEPRAAVLLLAGLAMLAWRTVGQGRG